MTIKLQEDTQFHLFWWGHTPESFIGFPGPGVGLALEGFHQSWKQEGSQEWSISEAMAGKGQNRGGEGRGAVRASDNPYFSEPVQDYIAVSPEL